MLCPNCHAECMAGDLFCHRCGTDLTLPSKSLHVFNVQPQDIRLRQHLT